MCDDRPQSSHDLDVIRRELAAARLRGCHPDEVVLSSRRVRVAGYVYELPIRLMDDMPLNEGMLVERGREPIIFGFEAEL
jgi:hypothetical protein